MEHTLIRRMPARLAGYFPSFWSHANLKRKKLIVILLHISLSTTETLCKWLRIEVALHSRKKTGYASSFPFSNRLGFPPGRFFFLFSPFHHSTSPAFPSTVLLSFFFFFSRYRFRLHVYEKLRKKQSTKSISTLPIKIISLQLKLKYVFCLPRNRVSYS